VPGNRQIFGDNTIIIKKLILPAGIKVHRLYLCEKRWLLVNGPLIVPDVNELKHKVGPTACEAMAIMPMPITTTMI
jgi:hypothetical protein